MRNNKANLSTLIANDIVHLGMDSTSNFNYSISLNDYTKEFDSETKDYIYNHKEDILEEIKLNENVADLQYDEKRITYDMVFYFDGLLDHIEKMIYTASDEMDKSLEIEDIRRISSDIYNDEDFTDKIITKVAKYGGYSNEV